MNRYKKANEGICAPEKLKSRVSKQKPRAYAGWIPAAAAVLVLALCAGIFFSPGTSPVAHAAGVIAEAAYPVLAPYPSDDYTDFDDYIDARQTWWKDVQAQRRQAPAEDGMAPFYAALLPELLGNSGGENRVISPLNLYLALAMLAETAGGNSRSQILDLLNADSISVLRQRASGLWNANYRDDAEAISRLAASVWLNEDITFHQDTMDRLAETYYASSYRGEMGSEQLNEQLRSWLNEQTGGLLEDYVANVELASDVILALATTIYFRTTWYSEFWEGRNTEDTFHGASGDTTAVFMHSTELGSPYYWGDRFSATSKPLREGTMWFILPDEGVSVGDLLQDAQVMEFLAARDSWKNQKALLINLSLPKFDVSSQVDLLDHLGNLGVTDILDPGTADFSPMTDLADVFLSSATHAARVMVDEKGVEAAAFTLMADAGAGMPPNEEIDFVLDRPFLFAITGTTGQILFVGVVNQV